MNTTSNLTPALTGANAQSFLSVQMRFTTQPFGHDGASDIALLHASLTYYRTYLEERLKNREHREQRKAEMDRTQIANLNDLLFDLQSALIDADRQRVEESMNLGASYD